MGAWGYARQVLAMDYLTSDGDEADNLQEVFEAMAEAGVFDLNLENNVRIQNRNAIVIDAGGL